MILCAWIMDCPSLPTGSSPRSCAARSLRASGGRPLPSVKQLQQEHDVGRDTVLRAIELLRGEGLVFTISRRGTCVSPQK